MTIISSSSSSSIVIIVIILGLQGVVPQPILRTSGDNFNHKGMAVVDDDYELKRNDMNTQ